MSQIEKLIKKFNKQPASVKYSELERILIHVECQKIQARGSHVKFKHRTLSFDIVIPVHKNECKSFYKQQVKKQIHELL
jgi:predicted RNA binding protein YcfA (HicA-like mRNA interferase family)